MITDLILGTAGHIDHGKTSLIGALTGTNTDRLPEEKRRGITIELGFAEMQIGDYRLGIVDVPGHERFVRNMLAGATGMDVALLVVAADDSIKPQTREHLDILRLLDLPAGVVAITKSDLVEPDWIDMVEEEIRDLVSDTFLSSAPIVRTAAPTGVGIEELRAKLLEASELAVAARPRKLVGAPFRMAIDRAFTMTGHGTVVTGSISSGTASLGDDLVIEPGNVSVRVRGLQNHDRQVESVHRGQRAAINLAGVHHDQLGRGQELASPGHLRPSRLLTVQLGLVAGARSLKNRTRSRLHLGTAEILANVVFLDRDRLESGESAPAQLFLQEPAVATWNQTFVLRTESPVTTIGGGQVLVPQAEKLRKSTPEMMTALEQLRSRDPLERASAAFYFAGLQNMKPADLARTAGVEDFAPVYEQLRERGDVLEIEVSPTRVVRIHQNVFAQLTNLVEKSLLQLHTENTLRSTFERLQLKQRFDYLGTDLFQAVLNEMRAAGRVRVTEKGVALVGQGPKLSQNERKLLARLIDQYRGYGLQVPTVQQVQKETTKNQDAVPQLIALAAADGDLVELNQEFYLHAEVEQQARGKLAERLAGGGLTMSEIRETLNTSRKYAVPFCEYLDNIGFTRREGDVRILVKSSATDPAANDPVSP